MSEPIRTLVSGVPGKLATAVAAGVRDADELELAGVYNPGRSGEWEGVAYRTDVSAVDVVVEAGPDHPVMDNLARWREAGVAVVVGTSGFTQERVEAVRRLWDGADAACLIVPNFSIGAVLMMRFAEIAAPHFVTTEVIERHSDAKPDAPSGTALGTASRIAAAGGRSTPKGEELTAGARGGDVSGVLVHSLRLSGLLSHQEVALTNPGEQLSVVHQSTSYGSFAAGAVAAIRGVVRMEGVSVGLDSVLGIP
ncbi:MAG TPA: 4-hydroxy-tetrahydrodipicolinate reductase [Acidimicrobiia bacterium]|nr:4-hydroxy-tetrahydrodipicolinate reductase [Acidimicrobiia bacterium]